MNLGKQKELVSRALKTSKYRVKFNIKTDEEKKRVKEILSREDAKALFEEKIVTKKPIKGISRTRANKRLSQRKKSRQMGAGSKRGTKNARFPKKEKWMIKIRALRKYLKNLKDNERITKEVFRDLYRKSKGNFFRNKNHMINFMDSNNLFVKNLGGKKDEK